MRGARVVAKNVLSAIDDPELKIYAVWMPVLAADDRESTVEARSTLEDSRVTHFWDSDQSLGRAFGRSLELPRGGDLAWDMYLVFPQDSEWGEELPIPSHWSHQLGLDERHLGDGSSVRRAIEALGTDPGGASGR